MRSQSKVRARLLLETKRRWTCGELNLHAPWTNQHAVASVDVDGLSPLVSHFHPPLQPRKWGKLEDVEGRTQKNHIEFFISVLGRLVQYPI